MKREAVGDVGNLLRSLPPRGAWIETQDEVHAVIVAMVAPPTGSVD